MGRRGTFSSNNWTWKLQLLNYFFLWKGIVSESFIRTSIFCTKFLIIFIKFNVYCFGLLRRIIWYSNWDLPAAAVAAVSFNLTLLFADEVDISQVIIFHRAPAGQFWEMFTHFLLHYLSPNNSNTLTTHNLLALASSFTPGIVEDHTTK